MECIGTHSRGFICSGGSGTLHLFEKTDDKYVYKKTRSVSVWVDPSSQLAGSAAVVPSGEMTTPVQDILSLTLSPSEETVVCSTGTQQLYHLTLSAADLQGKVGKEEGRVFGYMQLTERSPSFSLFFYPSSSSPFPPSLLPLPPLFLLFLSFLSSSPPLFLSSPPSSPSSPSSPPLFLSVLSF